VEILNGVADGFRHRAWVRAPWPDYNTYFGMTWPGAGDVDGDGIDEIVVGLGGGSQGWFAVLDDEAHGFAIVRWLRLGWPEFNEHSGETHPAVGNLDADAAEEIVIGLGRWYPVTSGVGPGGWFQIFDDLLANPGSEGMAWRQVPWPAYEFWGGATNPAVSRRRVLGQSRNETAPREVRPSRPSKSSHTIPSDGSLPLWDGDGEDIGTPEMSGVVSRRPMRSGRS
jgi:hypothetical protein